MKDRLIGYLLDALDAEETIHVEQALEDDVEIRRQLDLLRISLEPIEGDRTSLRTPDLLAIRTCEHVRAHRNSEGRGGE